uniref:Uncharacterized protein n=1 Tax=Arundo donax TaxID=35708 RepID=A0A0A9GPX1_ARUDO
MASVSLSSTGRASPTCCITSSWSLAWMDGLSTTRAMAHSMAVAVVSVPAFRSSAQSVTSSSSSVATPLRPSMRRSSTESRYEKGATTLGSGGGERCVVLSRRMARRLLMSGSRVSICSRRTASAWRCCRQKKGRRNGR